MNRDRRGFACRTAFTLVELLAVIAIIGTLVGRRRRQPQQQGPA